MVFVHLFVILSSFTFAGGPKRGCDSSSLLVVGASLIDNHAIQSIKLSRAVAKSKEALKEAEAKLEEAKAEMARTQGTTEWIRALWDSTGPENEVEEAKSKLEYATQQLEGFKALEERKIVGRTPLSKSEWKSVPSRAKAEYLRRAEPDFDPIHVETWDKKVKDKDAEKFLNLAREKAGDPEADPGYALVGKPSAQVTVFRLKDGTVIGGNVWLFQAGASGEGGRDAFTSASQARKAGYNPDEDISWNIKLTFDSEGKSVENGHGSWSWNGY